MKHACTRRMMRRSKRASAKGQPRGQMDEKTFTQLNYAQLQSDDLNLLKADLLATKDIVLRPGASASIAQPMNPDARLVGDQAHRSRVDLDSAELADVERTVRIIFSERQHRKAAQPPIDHVELRDTIQQRLRIQVRRELPAVHHDPTIGTVFGREPVIISPGFGGDRTRLRTEGTNCADCGGQRSTKRAV
jgi:Type VI secretion lipoprotein, VasD, EvfM, TssJ, VC_A0113